MMSHKENSPSEERLDRLEKRLDDWGAWGDYDSFDAWLEYQNKHVLPFAGGYLEQPLWIREAFKQYNMVWNFHHFTKHRKFEAPENLENAINPFMKSLTTNG